MQIDALLTRLHCSELLHAIEDGLYITDPDRSIVFWSKGAEKISGYPAHEVIGARCHDNILRHIDAEGNMLCKGHCPLSLCMQDGKSRRADVFLQHKQGYRVPVRVRVSPLRDDKGEVIGAIELFSDNSAQIAALERIDLLMQESLVDPLTQVGNRRYSEITLKSRFDEQARYGWAFAIMMADLDHFKRINDLYGHSIGDQVLHAAAQTISRAIRSFDFVGRWGGEEFLLCLPNLRDEVELRILAQRIRALVAESYVLAGEELVQVTISIGATIVLPEESISAAVKRADSLLYKSKNSGRNRVTIG